MKMYRYNQDYGRMGDLSGVFLADGEDLAWFMGAEVWADDILGKHSEVKVSFNLNTVSLIDVSEQTVAELHRVLGKNISGTTPYDFDYLIEEWREAHLLESLDEDE